MTLRPPTRAANVYTPNGRAEPQALQRPNPSSPPQTAFTSSPSSPGPGSEAGRGVGSASRRAPADISDSKACAIM